MKCQSLHLYRAKYLLLLLLCLAGSSVFEKSDAQDSKPNFGNDPAHGHFYMIRGFRMYCEIYGKGEPLLLIPGNGGSINAFSKNIGYYSRHFMVIAADSRAQGRSVDPQDSLSFEMMADDYAALLDTLHIKSSYVVGWSDGGINGLLLALRHPDKVKKLASSGANLWPDSTAILPEAWRGEQAYYEKFKTTDWKTAEQRNTWKLFLLDWNQPNIPAGELGKIKCPVLIISGDRDVINLEHALVIYHSLPTAWLWVLPHSGHPTLQEHADEFNSKTTRFFKEGL